MADEPVGNKPRSADVAGNSLKARTEAASAQQQEAQPALDKIVSGKVTQHKVPWYRRAARSMIADDASSVGGFLIDDVLVPAAKNLVRELIVGGTDRTLFGSRQGTRRGLGLRGETGAPQSLRTRYDQMNEPSRGMSKDAQKRHDFGAIELASREEALTVVETLFSRVQEFGRASVADLYGLLGVTGSYADQNHGWTNLDGADVRQYRSNWILVLPPTKPLGR